MEKSILKKGESEKLLTKAILQRKKYLLKCSDILEEITKAEVNEIMNTEIIFSKEEKENTIIKRLDVSSINTKPLELWPENELQQLKLKMRFHHASLDKMCKRKL